MPLSDRPKLESQAVLRLLGTLLAAYLTLLAPWFGRDRYRKFQKILASGDPIARTRVYQGTLVRKAILTAFVILLAFAGPISMDALGLTAPRSWVESARTLGMLLGAIAVSIGIFRYR